MILNSISEETLNCSATVTRGMFRRVNTYCCMYLWHHALATDLVHYTVDGTMKQED